jgi:hypothetical protein
LKQSLALVDFYASQLIECDEAIELKMKQLQQQIELPAKSLFVCAGQQRHKHLS